MCCRACWSPSSRRPPLRRPPLEEVGTVATRQLLCRESALQLQNCDKRPGNAGSSNALAWALGVIFGVLGGLLLAALIAWATVLILRRRRKQEAGTEDDAAAAKKKKAAWFFIPGAHLVSVQPSSFSRTSVSRTRPSALEEEESVRQQA